VGAAAGGRALTTAHARPDPEEGRALEEGQAVVARGGPAREWAPLCLVTHTPAPLLEEASRGIRRRPASLCMHPVLRPCQRLPERGREGRGGRGAWGVTEGDDKGRFITGWVRRKHS